MFRVIDYADEQKEMFYDKNGALIADFDRKTSFLRSSSDDHCVWHSSK